MTGTRQKAVARQRREKLPEAVRVYLVQHLAMFVTPSKVAQLVKDEYGLEVDRRLIQMYDATRAGQKPAKKWCALFAATRAAFLEKLAGIPEAERAVRVSRLAHMSRRAEDNKNYVLAASLLKQIAEEVGLVYTNRAVIAGDRGAPLMSFVMAGAMVGPTFGEARFQPTLSAGVEPDEFVFTPDVKRPIGANYEDS